MIVICSGEKADFLRFWDCYVKIKKETAKPYIHCFAVPNKKIGVTGFEPATSTSRTAYPIFNADLGCFINSQKQWKIVGF